tara:strand:+ start:1135 stop:1521 length:387 start_codon:yes stop_codon:yes gene_type:complete
MRIFNKINMKKDYLKIKGIDLWARVGVLEKERKFGQLFNLDIYIWFNFDESSKNDDLGASIDYSIIIKKIKEHSKKFSCLTIENYSEEIIKIIQSGFNPDRIKICLTKCQPPIDGFNGKVSIVKFFEK